MDFWYIHAIARKRTIHNMYVRIKYEINKNIDIIIKIEYNTF